MAAPVNKDTKPQFVSLPPANPVNPKIVDGSKNKTSLVCQIFALPNPLKSVVVNCLSEQDLSHCIVGFGKGPAFGGMYQTGIKVLSETIKSRMTELKKQKEILNQILAIYPAWRDTVKAWKGISLKDKIWLVRLYDLYNHRLIAIPPYFPQKDGWGFPIIDGICLNDRSLKKDTETPSSITPQLLKPEIRNNIEKALAEKEGVLQRGYYGVPISFCESICLLVNLSGLFHENGGLAKTPDLRKFQKLEKLHISGNLLTIAPDLRQNPLLKDIYMDHNSLTSAPDTSQNLDLETLDLWHNQINTPPNVSHNVKLKVLFLGENQLETAPDVKTNICLTRLQLQNNKLTKAPDISQNVDLEELYLSNNQLTTLPDVSKNLKLKTLALTGNPLSDEARKQLEVLRIARPGLNIEF